MIVLSRLSKLRSHPVHSTLTQDMEPLPADHGSASSRQLVARLSSAFGAGASRVRVAARRGPLDSGLGKSLTPERAQLSIDGSLDLETVCALS